MLAALLPQCRQVCHQRARQPASSNHSGSGEEQALTPRALHQQPTYQAAQASTQACIRGLEEALQAHRAHTYTEFVH